MQFLALPMMALQAVGQIYQGQVMRAESDAAASVAEGNARAARQQAGVREDLIRRHNRFKLGEQRAAAVQSGFDPNTGSLAELQGDSAGALEFDALTARYEGQLQALSFDTQAQNLRRQGKAASRTGYLNAFGTLMGGSTKPYGSGPGFSGTQAPAPVETRNIMRIN